VLYGKLTLHPQCYMLISIANHSVNTFATGATSSVQAALALFPHQPKTFIYDFLFHVISFPDKVGHKCKLPLTNNDVDRNKDSRPSCFWEFRHKYLS